MTFGIQTAGKIAGAPFKLIGGLGKRLLNLLPLGKGKKTAEAKRKDMEGISRPNNLPTIPIKFSFDIPKELGNDPSIVTNFPGFDQFKGQILDAVEDHANLAVEIQNGSHFSVTLKDIKEPILKINGKEMDIPKIMEAFQKAKGNPEHRDFFFTNFIRVLRNGKSVDVFVKEVDKFKPGEKAVKEKPKPKNEVKRADRKLKRAKSDSDYLESIYDSYNTSEPKQKSMNKPSIIDRISEKIAAPSSSLKISASNNGSEFAKRVGEEFIQGFNGNDEDKQALNNIATGLTAAVLDGKISADEATKAIEEVFPVFESGQEAESEEPVETV